MVRVTLPIEQTAKVKHMLCQYKKDRLYNDRNQYGDDIMSVAMEGHACVMEPASHDTLSDDSAMALLHSAIFAWKTSVSCGFRGLPVASLCCACPGIHLLRFGNLQSLECLSES